jgi:hypothetical protein
MHPALEPFEPKWFHVIKSTEGRQLADILTPNITIYLNILGWLDLNFSFYQFSDSKQQVLEDLSEYYFRNQTLNVDSTTRAANNLINKDLIVNNLNNNDIRHTGYYSHRTQVEKLMSKDQFIRTNTTVPDRNVAQPKKARNKLPFFNKELQRCHEIIRDLRLVVKPTDKGLGTAIMTEETYKHLCEDILHNKAEYHSHTLAQFTTPLEKKMTREFTTVTDNLIEQWSKLDKTRGYEDDKHLHKAVCPKLIHQWMDLHTIRLPYFYGIPKIKPNKPHKMRPIVGSHSWYTTPVAITIDAMLQMFVLRVKESCRSSTEYFHQLKNNADWKNGRYQYITTGDITSLYPNIDHNMGLDCINRYLTDKINPEMRGAIVQALAFTLKNNFFIYGDKIFHQQKGTAMGSPVAPSYAILTLSVIEQAWLRTIPQAIDGSIFYRRYIDDLCILTRTPLEDAALSFGQEQGLNVEWDTVNGKEGHFLDINLYIRESENKPHLYTTLFLKPGKKYTFTHWLCGGTSKSAKLGVAVGEFRRLIRAGGTRDQKEFIINMFMQRGYPLVELKEAWQRAIKTNREKTKAADYDVFKRTFWFTYRDTSSSLDPEKKKEVIVKHRPFTLAQEFTKARDPFPNIKVRFNKPPRKESGEHAIRYWGMDITHPRPPPQSHSQQQQQRF